jgi:hypothetical protein
MCQWQNRINEPNQGPELVEENGIPVLRTGQSLDPAIVNDTREMIRRPYKKSS